ncbi:uncharacterized protein [Nicotiana tomentosiformis]|uniref:uncharacterized protein n=1 Tax=Nicotiana tomentosiformis TaxID=4098 RepID=UPI00388CC15F
MISGGGEVNGVTYTTTKKTSKVSVTHGKQIRQVLEEDSTTFEDADGMIIHHNDVLVISLLVHDTNIKRVLIDPSRSINIILLRVVNEMQANDKIVPKAHTLSGFDNSSVVTKGEIVLSTFAEGVVKDTKFQVIDTDMAYNMILGRPWIHDMEENAKADALANLASVAEITNAKNAIYGTLPEDKKESQLLRRKASRYCLIHGNLYRKMFEGPLARCLGPAQVEYVMRQVHEGHYGNYAGGRYLVKTLIRAGYYWPKMEENAKTFVAKCDKCQLYGNNMHRPAELLHPIISPWPFMKLGMDIVGPLLQAKGKIKRITSSPYHPVANGQAESTKKVIINNLKKRLEESNGKWPEVLLGVLWAYPTTTKTGTRETLFSLVYGVEALISVEIGETSTRFIQTTEESNGEEMRTNLDLLEEKREVALIRMAAQKQIIERYYNRKAHLRYFKIGDFISKKVFQSTKLASAGKLSSNWEGPYRI